MAATISMVAASNPDGLSRAASRLGTSVASLRSQIATQQAGLTELQGGWQGTAATAALTRGRQDLQRQEDLASRLGSTQTALSSAGTNLGALRTEIQNVAAQATALGATVTDDGTVTAPSDSTLMTPAVAAAYTTSLQAMLTRFDAVDEATAQDIQLNFAPGDEEGQQAPEEQSIDELEPPEGATDTEVNQWWDGLSPEEQQRLIDEKPEWVGNVDTATHVSVYVPGTGATPWANPDPDGGNDLPTYVEQATWLRSDTEKVLDQADPDNDDTVATVIWMGYEPPSNVFQAANAHYADDNAPELASFINGIDSSRDTDPHLTVLGHSYGSTLASEALQRGTAADDVVFMGSPGLETNPGQYFDDVSPADLHLPEGHVYVQEARGDAVASLGRFGGTPPADLPGFTELSTGASQTPLGNRNESWWHSSYSMAGTTALYNQAVVVAGLGQDDGFVRREQ